jgi:hypothetical protein
MIIYLYTFSPLPPQLVEVEQGRVIINIFIWFFLFFILNRLYYKIINYYFKNKKKEKHSLFSPLPPQQVEVVRGERRKKEKK